jgi:hypothetical protein
VPEIGQIREYTLFCFFSAAQRPRPTNRLT